MLKDKCFILLVVTASILGSKAFAADVAVPANGLPEQTVGPRFEVESKSEATTRGNWGVSVQGTGRSRVPWINPDSARASASTTRDTIIPSRDRSLSARNSLTRLWTRSARLERFTVTNPEGVFCWATSG